MRPALVLQAFVLAACVASAGGTAGAGGQGPGAEPGEPAVRDTTAPAVEISAPSRGAFLDASRTPGIVLSGMVRDPGDVPALTIDGRRVEIDDDGRFELEDTDAEPGLHTYRLEALDGAGHLGTATVSVLYGAFGTTALDESVRGLLGPRALETVAHALGGQLDSLDFDALLRANGPIAESLRVEAARRGAISVSLVPRRNGLEVEVAVEGLEVELSYAGMFDADILVRAARASLGATLRPALAPDGSIAVDLEHPAASLEDFDLDVAGVGGEDLLRDEVGSALEGELLRLLRAEVPPRLAEQLATIDRSWSFGQGGAISVARLSRLGADERGLMAAADVHVEAESSGLVPASPGSLRTGTAAPELRVGGVAAAISNDLANALLHAAWVSGRLHRTIALGTEEAPTTVSTVTLLVPALAGVAPGDAPVQLVVEPLLPAVLEHSEDGDFALAVGELHLRLEALTLDGPVSLVTLVGRVDALVAFALEPQGSLSVSIADWTLQAEPLEARPGLPRGRELEELLDGVIEMFAIDLAGPLAELPLPAMDGVVATDLSVDAAGGWLLVGCEVTGPQPR